MCEKIIKCINLGDIENLKLEINKSLETNLPIKNYYHKKSGDNLLSHACRQGNLDILEYLHVTLHLDLEQPNFDGKTPLHYAAQYGNIDCVNYLLKFGVQVDCIKKADW